MDRRASILISSDSSQVIRLKNGPPEINGHLLEASQSVAGSTPGGKFSLVGFQSLLVVRSGFLILPLSQLLLGDEVPRLAHLSGLDFRRAFVDSSGQFFG